MNPTLQLGRVFSFRDNLPVFPGHAGETGLDGRVPIDVAEGTCSIMTQGTVDLALTCLAIPLDEFSR